MSLAGQGGVGSLRADASSMLDHLMFLFPMLGSAAKPV